MNRRIGFLGVAAWAWFWAATAVFGALRPSYSHIANTISELGAVGTPHATAWNVLGFILPGLLFAIVGAAIARAANPQPSLSRTFATILLVLSGLAVAGEGVMPAEMVNGVADAASSSTRGHFISSLISAAAWAVGALLLAGPMRRSANWRGLQIIGVALVVVALVSAFALRGILPDGLAQRIGNAFFCVWYVLMSLKLVRLSPRIAEARGHQD